MKPVRFRNNEGEFCALMLGEGRKYIQLIPLTAYGDTGMKVLKVLKRDSRHIKPLLYHGKPYPIGRALKAFRRAYRLFGGTKAVKSALYQ